MIHRIEHALVMDTDDIPGRGGYAVVGLSSGLTPVERMFVAENFGISDYLHDPQNDRAFYSFFRVPNGRRGFMRRFAKGLRRNGTQNRVFVHTMFLDDATFDALDGFPWLLADAQFRLAGTSEWQPLKLEYGPLLANPAFPPLEWTEEPDYDVVRRFQSRLALIGKRLDVDPADAVAAAITALQQGRRALLPQGSAYEQITLLAWSMLPIRDRGELAWTQHDSQNLGVTFDLANTPAAATLDRNVDRVARRIVAMNIDDHHEFHLRAARYALTVRGDAVASWLAWREELQNVRENLSDRNAILGRLTRLANTVRAGRSDPWVDGEEMLQLLWPNVERAVAEGQPNAVDRWASLLHDSGLGKHIFAEAPRVEWLDRIAANIPADALVRFFLFGGGAAAHKAVASWLLERRPSVAPEALARLTVQLAEDRSAHVEPLVRWLLEDKDGLRVLAEATRMNAVFGDMVLLATLLALRQQHPQASTYVRSTLLPHLEKSHETRQKVNEGVADLVALTLRDEPSAFLRFLQMLAPELQARLTLTVVRWLRDEREATLPLAREIVRVAGAQHPRAADLVVALAQTGEPAAEWADVLIEVAQGIDARGDAATTERFLAQQPLTRRFAPALSRERERVAPQEPGEGIDIDGLYQTLLPRISDGACVRALIELTEDAWTLPLVHAVTGTLARAKVVARWDTLVARIARVFGRTHAKEVSKLLFAFWSRVPERDVANLSHDIIAAARGLEREQRVAFVAQWTPRVRHLPEPLITVIRELERGESRSMRIGLAWRALDLGEATHATLNRLDDDLWNEEPRTYGGQMQQALEKFAGAKRVERVTRLIDVAASPQVLPTVKFIAEEMLPKELERVSTSEWKQLVRVAQPKLFARGSVLMSIARRLGGSDAAEALKDFEMMCRRASRADALDGIAAGRLDAEGWMRKLYKRVFVRR